MAHNFGDIDKYHEDQELRDRIRAVIRGVISLHPAPLHFERERLKNTLANLQPITNGTNVERILFGVSVQWDNPTHSNIKGKIPCVLIILRRLVINWWDYLLGSTDESLKSDGQIENHLETLERYIENGLENYVVVGDERHGFWLIPEGEYRASMEGVR